MRDFCLSCWCAHACSRDLATRHTVSLLPVSSSPWVHHSSHPLNKTLSVCLFSSLLLNEFLSSSPFVSVISLSLARRTSLFIITLSGRFLNAHQFQERKTVKREERLLLCFSFFFSTKKCQYYRCCSNWREVHTQALVTIFQTPHTLHEHDSCEFSLSPPLLLANAMTDLWQVKLASKIELRFSSFLFFLSFTFLASVHMLPPAYTLPHLSYNTVTWAIQRVNTKQLSSFLSLPLSLSLSMQLFEPLAAHCKCFTVKRAKWITSTARSEREREECTLTDENMFKWSAFEDEVEQRETGKNTKGERERRKSGERKRCPCNWWNQ